MSAVVLLTGALSYILTVVLTSLPVSHDPTSTVPLTLVNIVVLMAFLVLRHGHRYSISTVYTIYVYLWSHITIRSKTSFASLFMFTGRTVLLPHEASEHS